MIERRGELRGVHVLAGLLAFFAAIIAVNVAFAFIAVRSFPGEDVRRSYLQGLQYNETLAARRAQAELGWRVTAGLRQGDEGGVVEVVVTGRDGAPVAGAHLTGDLQWPTDSRHDRALNFQSAGAGRYTAPVPDLTSGRWRLRARAESTSGDALDFESELTWR